jgi:hypothetical protein
MGERRGPYRGLVCTPEGRRTLGIPRCRWENIVKIGLQQVRGEGMVWIDVAQDRDKWRVVVNAVMHFWVSVNYREFLD